MATRVTSKGQVTIPKRVRHALGIRPGTAVEFSTDEKGRVVTIRANGKHWNSVVRRLRGSAKGTMTTDEIMRMTRGDDWTEKAQRRRKAA